MRSILFGFIICFPYLAVAQYFQFSQYNFTSQRINPAQVAGADYAKVSFVYRNQATAGGFHLTSNSIHASYPLIAKNGTTWSGIGISLLDDRSGTAGIFSTQEVALSYAVNIPIAFRQTLSLGAKGLYQDRKINLDGFYTGSQYIPDRGFDENASNDENLTELRNSFMTFSSGLHWQQVDKQGNRLAYFGISFFDFNKPEDSFQKSSSQLNSTLVSSLGFRTYHKDQVSVFPEILFTYSASKSIINAGCITRYEIKPVPNRVAAQLDIITKYVVGRSGIIGLQLHRENFSIGFSYDFPVIRQNVANLHAFEVGLELRKLVKPKKKNVRLTQQRKPTPSQPGKKPTIQAVVQTQVKDTTQLTTDTVRSIVEPHQEDMSARLKQKQDSIRAIATAGTVSHEALVLEKATLHFNFKFNSSELDENAIRYLDDLAKAMIDNPDLKILLTGHTDNIGSEKFNQRLSIFRAQSIKDFMLSKGIPENRISVNGKGMSEPLVDNETEESRSKNRRVELLILYDH